MPGEAARPARPSPLLPRTPAPLQDHPMDSTLIRRLTWGIERVLILLSIAIAVVVFLQVVFRYVLRQPLFWSEELPRYLLIWMSFLAAAVAQKQDAHINITLCLAPLAPRARRILQLLTNGIVLGFLGILVYSGGLVTNITAHHRSTALQLPMGFVYAALPVGACLMMLYLVLQIVDGVRRLRAGGA
jgi:TRAP-type transport system small permease protein